MIRRGKVAELTAELATARREIAQLTNELQRLKMEGLRGNAVAAAIELADRLAVPSAEEAEPANDALQGHLQALVLRETILDLCESVERAMVSVRAQLSSDLRPTELDRRRGHRRLSDRVATAPVASVGIDGLRAISATDPSSKAMRSPNGDGKADAAVTDAGTAAESARPPGAGRTGATKTGARRTGATKTGARRTRATDAGATETDAAKTGAAKSGRSGDTETVGGPSNRKPRPSGASSTTGGGSRSTKE
jgi:hypothetical protein